MAYGPLGSPRGEAEEKRVQDAERPGEASKERTLLEVPPPLMPKCPHAPCFPPTQGTEPPPATHRLLRSLPLAWWCRPSVRAPHLERLQL